MLALAFLVLLANLTASAVRAIIRPSSRSIIQDPFHHSRSIQDPSGLPSSRSKYPLRGGVTNQQLTYDQEEDEVRMWCVCVCV
jgi:hypothetical protein